MGVYVKYMEIPPNCLTCMKSNLRTVIGCTAWKHISAGLRESHKASDCPLIEVTEPHGRLIDADEMIKDVRRWENHPDAYIRNRNKEFIYYLENSDTVIEAEYTVIEAEGE